MDYRIKRVPGNYQGIHPTGRTISDLLEVVLNHVEKVAQDKPNEVIEFWSVLVGEKVASMTKAVSFHKGSLLVKVANATLYSMLVNHEKAHLIKQLQEKFPHLKITNIVFRMG